MVLAAAAWMAGCAAGATGRPPSARRADPGARGDRDAHARPDHARLRRAYASPCSVLRLEDVERIYGPLTRRGYVRQEFSMTRR